MNIRGTLYGRIKKTRIENHVQKNKNKENGFLFKTKILDIVPINANISNVKNVLT